MPDKVRNIFFSISKRRNVNWIFVQTLEILEYSIKKVGYNLKGAMETSREANGSKMCPIMVNLLQKLVVFPTHSAKHVETMWLNPDQIQRTYGSKLIKRKTNIEFKNGLIISVDSRLSFFNDKLKRAEQYCDTTIAAAQHLLSFITNQKTIVPYPTVLIEIDITRT
jgi:competence protein ComK